MKSDNSHIYKSHIKLGKSSVFMFPSESDISKHI